MQRVKVIVGPSAEGGYAASIPGMSNTVYEAESREEALEMVQEAISLYLDGGKHQIEIEESEAVPR